jgi:hypothetical protein
VCLGYTAFHTTYWNLTVGVKVRALTDYYAIWRRVTAWRNTVCNCKSVSPEFVKDERKFSPYWKIRTVRTAGSSRTFISRKILKPIRVPSLGRLICLLLFIALMMEAVRTSETSVNFNVTTRRYIPEDTKLYTDCVKINQQENYNSLKFIIFPLSLPQCDHFPSITFPEGPNPRLLLLLFEHSPSIQLLEANLTCRGLTRH